MKVVLLSLFLFGVANAYLTCQCGWETAGTDVHGYLKREGEYPWMVAIMKKTKTTPFCSGTIVTPWHIITSAKCVSDHKAKDLKLVVGANDLKSQISKDTKQFFDVEKIIVHSSYDKATLVGDIAVLVTNEIIEFTDYVGPACLPNGILPEELPGKEMKIMGWGKYNSKSSTDRKKVNEVDLEFIAHDTCKREKGKSQFRLCAGAIYVEDTCKGESGDPVVWADPDNGMYTLLGIVSSGPKECSSKDPGVSTSVQAYIYWINKQISNTKEGVKTCREVDMIG